MRHDPDTAILAGRISSRGRVGARTPRKRRLAMPRMHVAAAGLLGVCLLGCGGSGSRALSSNSRLASLSTSLPAPLSPAFDPATTAYAIGPVTASSVTVAPRVEDPRATVTVGGVAVASGAASAPRALGVGVTTLSVVVRAEDGTTTTYSLAIDRTSAQLAALAASAGPLDPTFQPGVLTYTVGPAFLPETTTLTPTAVDPNAAISVNGITVPSGAASPEFALAVGVTPVTVTVTARGGATTVTYTVLFSRSVFPQETDLKASNAESGDLFGFKVALSGDTLVVGAPGESAVAVPGDNGAPMAGAVYVFVRTGGAWLQQAYLKASNAETGDNFGLSLAISGDTLAVGAP
jgi:hypothetical protein